MHAQTSAVTWANFVSEISPDIKEIVRTGKPSARTIALYRDASRINHLKQFTILNAIGQPVYEFHSTLSGAQNSPQAHNSKAIASISRHLVQQMTGGDVVNHELEVVNSAVAPILKNGAAVGAIHVIVDQSKISSIFVDAALEGSREILILVNLVLLACWFVYVILNRTAARYNINASRTDELTGLPSRSAFMQELEDTLALNQNRSHKTAVLVVKIDRFRELNELLGHDGADGILREVAKRLHRVAGTHGFAARISGNTFAVKFPQLASVDDAATIGKDIISSLAEPYLCRGKHIQPKASIGICLAPDDGNDAQTILKRADVAQFIANENGGNQLKFYDPETAARFARRHELESHVIRACEEQLFELHYQPLMCMQTRKLKGFEALLRLPDGKGGMIPPDIFIATAEAMHKIDEIGAWVLYEACRTASYWPKSVSIAVNLSPLQFESGYLIDNVRQALASSGLEPERLELEITENLLLDSNDLVRSQLDAFQALGIKIALDDFGTGYSSLNYLWRFPFDSIKVDRSFVAGMNESEQAKGILKTIVELAATMNLPITAEGIETVEQLEFLADLGCDVGQGYLLGRPQPARDVAAVIMQNFRLTQAEKAAMEKTYRPAVTLSAAG
jgi:diguanylate cyclase (GGDEF)-like protein